MMANGVSEPDADDELYVLAAHVEVYRNDSLA